MDVVFVLRIYLNEYCFHAQGIYEWGNFQTPEAPHCTLFQGRIQDFKLGGRTYKNSAERVFRVKNHDFTQKNHIFSNFRGAPPGSAPVFYLK
jgi:hypothetical protein